MRSAITVLQLLIPLMKALDWTKTSGISLSDWLVWLTNCCNMYMQKPNHAKVSHDYLKCIYAVYSLLFELSRAVAQFHGIFINVALL